MISVCVRRDCRAAHTLASALALDDEPGLEATLRFLEAAARAPTLECFAVRGPEGAEERRSACILNVRCVVATVRGARNTT